MKLTWKVPSIMTILHLSTLRHMNIFQREGGGRETSSISLSRILSLIFISKIWSPYLIPVLVATKRHKSGVSASGGQGDARHLFKLSSNLYMFWFSSAKYGHLIPVLVATKRHKSGVSASGGQGDARHLFKLSSNLYMFFFSTILAVRKWRQKWGRGWWPLQPFNFCLFNFEQKLHSIYESHLDSPPPPPPPRCYCRARGIQPGLSRCSNQRWGNCFSFVEYYRPRILPAPLSWKKKLNTIRANRFWCLLLRNGPVSHYKFTSIGPSPPHQPVFFHTWHKFVVSWYVYVHAI